MPPLKRTPRMVGLEPRPRGASRAKVGKPMVPAKAMPVKATPAKAASKASAMKTPLNNRRMGGY